MPMSRSEGLSSPRVERGCYHKPRRGLFMMNSSVKLSHEAHAHFTGPTVAFGFDEAEVVTELRRQERDDVPAAILRSRCQMDLPSHALNQRRYHLFKAPWRQFIKTFRFPRQTLKKELRAFNKDWTDDSRYILGF